MGSRSLQPGTRARQSTAVRITAEGVSFVHAQFTYVMHAALMRIAHRQAELGHTQSRTADDVFFVSPRQHFFSARAAFLLLGILSNPPCHEQHTPSPSFSLPTKTQNNTKQQHKAATQTQNNTKTQKTQDTRNLKNNSTQKTAPTTKKDE